MKRQLDLFEVSRSCGYIAATAVRWYIVDPSRVGSAPNTADMTAIYTGTNIVPSSDYHYNNYPVYYNNVCM